MKHLKNRIFLILIAALPAFQITQAETFVWDNGEPDSNLWGDAANWNPDGVPSTNADTAAFSGGSDLAINLADGNYTVSRYTRSGPSAGFEHTVYASAGGSLTIDINSATNAPGIQNATTGAGGGTLRFNNINVIINNTGQDAVGDLTFIRNDGDPGNIMLFDTTSTLTVTTRAQMPAGGGGSYQLNGTLLASSQTIQFNSPNISLGEGHDSSAFGQDFVMLANSKVSVDGGTVLTTGRKFQVNGTNAELELNGADSINDANVVVGGTNVFLIDVNANQSDMGNLVDIGGSLTLDLDPAVTLFAFNNSSAAESNWAGGTLTIDGFQEGVIRFGTDPTGLTRDQLAVINGGIYSLTSDGYLTEEVIDYWARFEIDAEGYASLSPWIELDAFVGAAPFIWIDQAGLCYMNESVGLSGNGWVYSYELDALGLTLVDGMDYGYSFTLNHWVYLPNDISGETEAWLYLF